MERQIVAYRIPFFRIAIARLEDRSLNGRPVAVAWNGPRSILTEVSVEALEAGVSAGMPRADANSVCRSLRIVPPESPLGRAAERYLLALAARSAPLWEPVAPGHFFLDLTRSERLLGKPADHAGRIARDVMKSWSLKAAIGLGRNKLVSEIAAVLAGPAEMRSVAAGSERDFLAPLPVSCLPDLSRLYGGKTPDVLEMLEDLNLATLGDLAATAAEPLELVLGPVASLIRQWALGIDPSPVTPPLGRPALELSQTLEAEEMEDSVLLAHVFRLAERLCRRLRLEEKACRGIKLALTYVDGKRIDRRFAMAAASHHEREIYPVLRELFLRSFERRVAVRTVAIQVDALERQAMQLDLFPSAVFKRGEPLSLAVDRLRERHGEDILKRGA